MLSVNMSIVYTIVNLLILYAFFRKFLFGRVEKILEERRKSLEDAGKELEREMAESKAAREKYEAQARELESQKQTTLSEWRSRGFEERERIIAEAKVDAGRIIAGARKEAMTEATVIREKNQEALKEMVIDAASRICARRADEASDGALYDAFLRELENGGAEAAS